MLFREQKIMYNVPGSCVKKKTRKYLLNISVVFLSCLRFWKIKSSHSSNGEFDVHPTLSRLLTQTFSHLLLINSLYFMPTVLLSSKSVRLLWVLRPVLFTFVSLMDSGRAQSRFIQIFLKFFTQIKNVIFTQENINWHYAHTTTKQYAIKVTIQLSLLLAPLKTECKLNSGKAWGNRDLVFNPSFQLFSKWMTLSIYS